MSLKAEAQLSYASVDRGGGRGGWQVKELLGDLSADVVQQILHDIPAQLPTPNDAGRFVSRQELEKWPRRLLYRALDDVDVRIVIHSAAAGADRSGRPGNVFSHVLVLDREQSRSYPISLWRSADWLTPFGPDGVSEATLREGPFRASSELAADVQVFLAGGDAWRTGILAVLLDLVGAAMRGGKAPVLLVGSADEAAGWVKAVSVCLPPKAAGEFFFSTLEPPLQASAMATRLHLICVLRSELGLDRSAFEDLVVLDADVDVEVGTSNGQPHVLGDGIEVPAGEWSQAVFDYLTPGVDLTTRVEGLAALEQGICGQATNPAWWLWAYIVGEDPAALDEGATLLARYAPPDVDQNQTVMPLVNRAMALTMGTTTAERWAVLEEMLRHGTRGVTARSATEQYLTLALSDGPWLLQHPALPPDAWGDLLSVHLGKAVDEAVPSADQMSPDDRIVVYVRLLDAIHRGRWTAASVAAGAERYLLQDLAQITAIRGVGSSLSVDEDLHPNTDRDLVSVLRTTENPDAIPRRWLERLDMMRVPDLVDRHDPVTSLDRRVARELLADLVGSGKTAKTSAKTARTCAFALLVLGTERSGDVLANLVKAEVTAEQCTQALRSPGADRFSLRVVCSALLSADPWGQAAQELLREMRVVGRTNRNFLQVCESVEVVQSLSAYHRRMSVFQEHVVVVLSMLNKVYKVDSAFGLHGGWNSLLRIAALCSSMEIPHDPPRLPEIAVPPGVVRRGINAFHVALEASGRDPLEFVLPVRVADRRYESKLAHPRKFGETESGMALSVALAQEVIVALVRRGDANLDEMVENFSARFAQGSIDAEGRLLSALAKWAKGVPELRKEGASLGGRASSALSKVGSFFKRKEGSG